MRNKLTALSMVVLTALAVGSASPLMLRAQAGGGVGTGVPGAASTADDMPHRTARAFAPFMRALILRRTNQALQIFKMRRGLQNSLDQPETAQMLGRFQKPDRLDLNLVGGRTLGQNIGILFFTITNQEGPMSFKIYYYGFGEDIYIDRIDIGDSWDDIEAAAASVETLQNPITVSLGQIDANGQ